MINRNVYDITINKEVVFQFDKKTKKYMYVIFYCLKDKYPEDKILLIERNHQIFTRVVDT